MRALPSKISGFRADTINDIIDYIEQLTPLGTRDFRYERTGQGTILKPRGLPPMPPPFQWDEVDLGYRIGANVFTALAGEIVFRDQTFSVAETALTIAADNTYVYLEMEWGTGTLTWKQTTTRAPANPSSTCFRKWYYLVGYSVIDNLAYVKKYGFLNPIITPVFA